MLVKKYANRRLYDTDASRYVTLEELAEKVRAGADPRVLDAATGDDLTQTTLAQIILESRGAARMLPIGLLMQLIRLGDDALSEFLGKYLSTALELYLTARQGAVAMAPYNPFASAPFAATSALARMMMGGAQQAAQGLGGMGWGEPAAPAAAPQHAPATPPPPPPSAPGAGHGDDVATLRREIEELKRSVQREPEPPRRPRAKPAHAAHAKRVARMTERSRKK